MFTARRIMASLLLAFCVIVLPVFASEPIPRGVSRAKGSFYKAGVPFKCLDGSQTIPFDQINDDYCDCADGSDEPGTSACRNGRFYCVNKGYKPESIPSSRVSDGICDCCDGSDEYDQKVKCENTCIELGRSMREEMLAMKKLVEEGYRIRSEYAAQGKTAKLEKQEQLVSLGPKREVLGQTKDELMLKKEAAEQPEKAAKEVHEAWWKEQKAIREAEKEKAKAAEAFAQLDTNQDNLVSMAEMQARAEFDTNGDGTVSEEEVTILLTEAVDTMDLAQFTDTYWELIKKVYKPPVVEVQEPAPPAPTEAVPPPTEATAGDDEDDDSDFDEDDFDEGDDDNEEAPPPPTEDNFMPAYPEETQVLMSVADAAREEYNKAEKEYNEVDREIQDIEKFLAQDLGPDDVFYPLRDQCYEYTDREYTYKFCPFEKATQKPKDGGTETSLGTFTKWEANGDDSYGSMKFEKGLHCWNGPDRSASVKFMCGTENKLANGAEPNRCEYTFEFTTPAACHSLPDDSESEQLDVEHVHTEL